MPHDWREELEKDPRMLALDRALEQRKRELSSDPPYVLKEEPLKRRLEKYHAQNPKIVTDFFRRFSWPAPSKLKSLNAFLRKVQDTSLRDTLQDYFQFASRFSIVFSLRKSSPHFETSVDLPNPTKFHVRVENGQLAPIIPDDPVEYFSALELDEVSRPIARPPRGQHAKYVRVQDCPVADDELTKDSAALQRDCPVADADPIELSFASDQLEVPPALARAIESGQAKVVQIDDRDGSSCLSAIEHVGCSADCVTFIRHNAEQKFLLLAIGANVPTEQLRKLGPAVTAIRREDLGRGRAGRPKKLEKLARAKQLLTEPGPLKYKAIELGGKDGNFKTDSSYLSRLRREKEES